MSKINCDTAIGDNKKVCHRQAGQKDSPVLLLLHGFPSSGHMFRDLIPALAGRYRIVAPDRPGFGDTGHFELETHHAEISSVIRDFLVRTASGTHHIAA